MGKRPVTFETYVNSTERITYRVTDTSGVLTNPGGSVSFRQITPANVDTTVTTGWTNSPTGTFYRDITFDTSGVWRMSAWVAGAEAQEYLVDVASVFNT